MTDLSQYLLLFLSCHFVLIFMPDLLYVSNADAFMIKNNMEISVNKNALKKADLKTSSKKYQKILSVDRNRRNIYTRLF